MSRLSFKMLIASLCVALATTSTATAQMSQMRLFSPYPDDEFGGGVYMNEGFYGSIGAGIVMITAPPDQTVGDSDNGSSVVVSNVIGGANSTSVITYYPTASQINTGVMHPEWATATEFEVGNQRGHHGWSVKGTIVSPQRYNQEGYDAGIALSDPAVVSVTQYGTNGNYYVWNRGSGTDVLYKLEQGYEAQIGRLWGLVSLNGSGTSGTSYSGGGSSTNNNNDSTEERYAFIPIPLTYDTWKVNAQVNTWSVEAMYNYRFHPFRRGVLELLAGVRYTCFDENFSFIGHSTTKLTTEYSDARIEILQTGTQSSTGGQAVTSTSQSFVQNTQQQSSEWGADLGYSNWKFDTENHLVGPQVGLRFITANNRWRFMAEGKFFAALNRQNIFGDGDLGLKASSNQSTNLTSTSGTPLYAPVFTVQNHISYSNHFTEFTPGADIKLEAAWHWTQAVSFKFGYQVLYLGNLVRAAAVNDYAMNTDGTIFRMKSDKDERNFDTFVHGAMFTVQVNK